MKGECGEVCKVNVVSCEKCELRHTHMISHVSSSTLANFGIAAKMTKTLMKHSTFIGTPYWMAPEMAAVEKKVAYDQKVRTCYV